jgi:hypothetical protein
MMGEKLKNKVIDNHFGTQMQMENLNEAKHLCPLCKKESFVLTESGIGDFKNGGNCYIGECRECGYKTII